MTGEVYMARVVVRIRWQTEVIETAPVYAPVTGPLDRGPSTTHLLALVTLFTGLLLAVTLRYTLGAFQQNLLRQSISALHEQGIENAEIRFSGLDATITGVRGSNAVSEAARLALLAVPGVRSVRVRILDSGFDPVTPPVPSSSPTIEVAEALAELRTDLLLFRPGGVALNPSSSVHLARLAKALAAHPEAAIEIQGHTDSWGDPHDNMMLSVQRADAVRTSMAAFGVSYKQLFAAGFGATRPRGDNNTAAGRALNRRIELRLRGSD